ncbi:hypothetical protein O6R05_00740 [Peptoniphilus equinus]|uniref:Diaminopimelate epimerase n=1 Tax=Peptoniphilus equinus TaxID=3016343 RepID=A0ABY7QTK4_9FIRM|nr:hypothetical protein [Peptoniphilus equinus]WBW50120.1 hypothetical protein O6R05_00740 [Peptoniphilus equinus]
MKKSFEYFKADPAGNGTGFVISPVYPGYRRAYAKAIMAKDPTIEQVGFISPSYDSAPLRMEMMGSEFCANATRAYGLYSAGFYDTKGDVKLAVYVSGVDHPVDVIVNQEEQTAYVKVEGPFQVESLEVAGASYPVVVMPGITHMIVESNEDEAFVNQALEKLVGAFDASAYGIIFLNRESTAIVPYIHVPAAETKVLEGSCASGSVAAAVILNDKDDPDFEVVIHNPRGDLEVYADDTETKGYIIGGLVTLGETETVTITISKEEVDRVRLEHKKELEALEEQEASAADEK